MKIVVLLKVVPDTETRFQLDEPNKDVVWDQNIEWIMNPWDENALEESIRIKEKLGGEITVITLGEGKHDEQVIRKALAMGADKAMLITTENINGLNPLNTAEILAKAIEKESPDLVFTGMTTADMDTRIVHLAVASNLGIPFVANALVVEAEEGKVKVTRNIEGGAQEIFEVTLPALLTADQGLNEARYPKLPDIMKAKRKPIEKLTPSDLGVEIQPPSFERVSIAFPPQKEGGRILEGELPEQIRELVRILAEEEKVI